MCNFPPVFKGYQSHIIRCAILNGQHFCEHYSSEYPLGQWPCQFIYDLLRISSKRSRFIFLTYLALILNVVSGAFHVISSRNPHVSFKSVQVILIFDSDVLFYDLTSSLNWDPDRLCESMADQGMGELAKRQKLLRATRNMQLQRDMI